MLIYLTRPRDSAVTLAHAQTNCPHVKKTRAREKPGLVLGLAFEKPGLDNRKPGLQIVKYWIR